MQRIQQLFVFISFILLLSSSALAKEISLYDQPKEGAAVVGKIDIAAGFVPIFSPKDDKTWVKIGDPKNGNVGWVKSSDMGGQSTSASVTVQVGETPNSVPPKNTPEYIQRMTEDITKGFQNLYKQQQQLMQQQMPKK